MLIKEINYIKETELFEITTSTGEIFHINYELVEKYKICIDKTIDKDLLISLEYNENLENAKKIALNFISYRLRTKSEIKKKLESKQLDSYIIDDTIYFLEMNDFINDEYFSRNFIEEKSRINGWSFQKIKYELFNKGVSSSITNILIEEFYDEKIEIEKANKLISPKINVWRKKHENYKLKQKIYQFLYSKGFSSSTINSVLKKENL